MVRSLQLMVLLFVLQLVLLPVSLLVSMPAILVEKDKEEVGDILFSHPSNTKITQHRGIELNIMLKFEKELLHSSGIQNISINFTNQWNTPVNVSVELSVTIGNLSWFNATSGDNGSVMVQYTAPSLDHTQEVSLGVVANRTFSDEKISNYTFLVLSRFDTELPRVIISTPQPFQDNISEATNITLTFSEAMNCSSVESALSVSPATHLLIYWFDKNVSLVPVDLLESETLYYINISGEAMDLYGNPMLVEYSLSFTTQPQVSKELVIISSISSNEIMELTSANLTIRVYDAFSIPVSGVDITIGFEGPIQISTLQGTSDLKGYLNCTVWTFNVTENTAVILNIACSKENFIHKQMNLSLTIVDSRQYIIQDSFTFGENLTIDVLSNAKGVISVDVIEIPNPSWFETGFMGLFYQLRVRGSGSLYWCNLSISGLDHKEGFIPDHISIKHFLEPAGPWVDIPSSGFTSDGVGTLWANISGNQNISNYTFAPREDDITLGLGSISGIAVDTEGNYLPGISIGLLKNGVNQTSVYTGPDGKFQFTHIEPGMYQVKLGSPLFANYEVIDVEVLKGKVSILDDLILDLGPEDEIPVEDDEIMDEDDDTPIDTIQKPGEDDGEFLPRVYIVLLVIFIIMLSVTIVKYFAVLGENKKEYEIDLAPGTQKRKGTNISLLGKLFEEEYECPICGNGIGRNENSCSVCNSNFVPDKLVCPDCGMPLRPNDSSCGMCGTRFGLREKTSGWQAPGTQSSILQRSEREAIDDFYVVDESDVSFYDVFKTKK